jgi:polygalacturonase
MKMIKPYRCALAFALCAINFAAQAKDCNVLDYGAKPGDEIKDTSGIQAAIDACAARPYGGRVVVPEGRWISGQIRLKSDIDLHIARGALLQGSADLADYPKMDSAAALDHGEDALKRDGLIVADNVERVALTGSGTIDGNGEAFWDKGFLQDTKSRPTLPRPMPWIAFRNARDVRVRDLSFRNSPSYGVNITESTLVRMTDIRIENAVKSPNTDGIQIVDSSDVVIAGVYIRTGDDAIVLKSHRRPIEDIVVRDSLLISDDAAFKLGTGSEQPIRRISLVDTSIRDSRFGITLFMKDGGLFEDIAVRNVRFSGRRSRHITEYPIYFDIDRRTARSALGRVRDIRLEGLRLESRGNLLIQGHPQSPIEGLRLRDIEFVVGDDAVDLTALRGKPRGNALVGTLPDSVDYSRERAHITIAHAREVSFDDVRVQEGDAVRPVLFVKDVHRGDALRVVATRRNKGAVAKP